MVKVSLNGLRALILRTVSVKTSNGMDETPCSQMRKASMTTWTVSDYSGRAAITRSG